MLTADERRAAMLNKNSPYECDEAQQTSTRSRRLVGHGRPREKSTARYVRLEDNVTRRPRSDSDRDRTKNTRFHVKQRPEEETTLEPSQAEITPGRRQHIRFSRTSRPAHPRQRSPSTPKTAAPHRGAPT